MSKVLSYLLILFLIFLIFSHCLTSMSRNLVEGATGSIEKEDKEDKEYIDPGLQQDSLYLSKINAANISYLKERIDELGNLRTKVAELDTTVQSNSAAIQGLNTAMQNVGNQSIPDQQTTQDLANSQPMTEKF
jgi:hypothetical protein